MDFRILGPLEVRDGDREVRLRGGKQRALLALLLVNADRTLAVERIVDELWGEDVPETAQKMVQIYVSHLRKVLPPGTLHTRPPGYAVVLEREQLDLHRFETAVAAARAALDAGRAQEAADGFGEALSLWRGPALAEFAVEPFAQPEGARLEELRVSALEGRVEADLRLGRHGEIGGELEALIARHPFREGLRRQQMLALYRSGRQAEALAAYQEARCALADELGIEPSPTLRDLERRILQQDASLDLPMAHADRRAGTSTALSAPAVPRASRPIVGRDGELGRLRRLLGEAEAGTRRLVFVSGEAGIGKTALVETLLAGVAGEELLIGRGQCIEQHGAGEAYMPVLEALGRLCRQPGGDEVVDVLAERAPTWLAQLPWLSRAAVARGEVGAVSAERMLREIVEALEAAAQARPLALVLEDLHWSDASTVDLLSALARRGEPARLLVLGTYRPEDAKASGNPVWEVARSLRLRGLGSELALGALNPRTVAAYLDSRFPGSAFPVELARLLHERTGGNPLFVEQVVDSWVAAGSIVVADERVELAASLDDLAVDLPDSLRQLIEQQLDALEPGDQELLEAASAAGKEVPTALVAAATGRADDEIERRLTGLARQRRFVVTAGEAVWPDGTASTSYAFLHDVYQEVLYQKAPPGRRTRHHQEIGARLETAFGERVAEVAGELAAHFMRGHLPERAVPFLHAAAEQALARSGHREAMKYLDVALDALQQLPPSRARAQRELALRITLGNALITSRGYAAPETKEAYARARDLCAELGDAGGQLLPILYGLCAHEFHAGRHEAALELGETFLQLAEQQDDDAVVVAHRLVGWPLFFLGRFERAREHFEEIVRRFDPERHEHLLHAYQEDPGVAGRSALAVALWFLGHPGRAAATSAEGLARARSLGHPFSLIYALFFDALRLQLAGEGRAAGERAEEARAIAAEQAIVPFQAWASAVRGWWWAAAGEAERGVAELEGALSAARASSTGMVVPYMLTLLADARRRAGRVDEALLTLDEALAVAAGNGERWCEAETLRLRGELLLEVSDERSAEQALRQALALARAQEARALERRAALSLARLRGARRTSGADDSG